MARAGINKKSLARFGGETLCFMSDEDVAEAARANGTTRATACMDKACALKRPFIFAVGNAPTALIRLYELIGEGKLHPALIIGVPVGFVNVVESKELIDPGRGGAPRKKGAGPSLRPYRAARPLRRYGRAVYTIRPVQSGRVRGKSRGLSPKRPANQSSNQLILFCPRVFSLI